MLVGSAVDHYPMLFGLWIYAYVSPWSENTVKSANKGILNFYYKLDGYEVSPSFSPCLKKG